MKKGLEEDLNSAWWGLINQVLTIYKEDIREKLQNYDYDSD
jgi:hypothetical protein